MSEKDVLLKIIFANRNNLHIFVYTTAKSIKVVYTYNENMWNFDCSRNSTKLVPKPIP